LKQKQKNFIYFRIEKTIWQDRLNEMSWRDGFTEEMFNRLQCILEFACNQLQTKKTVKKHIDEVNKSSSFI